MLSGPRLFFVRNDNTSAAALSASPMKEVRPMRLHTSTSPPDRLPVRSAAQCIIRPDGPAAVSWPRLPMLLSPQLHVLPLVLGRHSTWAPCCASVLTRDLVRCPAIR